MSKQCLRDCKKNRIFVAENPEDRVPLGTICTQEGDLWINPALCLLYVFSNRCWKLVNCQPKVMQQTLPCDAQLVWFDGCFKAGALIDTEAVIPDGSSVVFCGPNGLSLGFLPEAPTPSGCTALSCNVNFMTFDEATQTPGCGSLAGPTGLPCAPRLVYCDPINNNLTLGDVLVNDPATVPCDASLIFCDGTSIVQSQVPVDGAPLLCESDLFLVCGGTAGIAQRGVFNNGIVPCLPELIFCQPSEGLSRGVVGPGEPLSCANPFVVCQGNQWVQASIGGTGGTLGPADRILFCNDQDQIAFGTLPQQLGLHYQTSQSLTAQPDTMVVMGWSPATPALDDFGPPTWVPATGVFTVPSDGMYQVEVTGIVQMEPSPASARSGNFRIGIRVDGTLASRPSTVAAWLDTLLNGFPDGSYGAASVLMRLTAGQEVTVTLGLFSIIGTGFFGVELDLTIQLISTS